MIKIIGQIQLEYFYCRSGVQVEQCTNINDPKFATYVEKMTVLGTQEVGSKTITTLEVKQEEYTSLNNVEKRLMVVIVIRNKKPEEVAAVAI